MIVGLDGLFSTKLFPVLDGPEIVWSKTCRLDLLIVDVNIDNDVNINANINEHACMILYQLGMSILAGLYC